MKMIISPALNMKRSRSGLLPEGMQPTRPKFCEETGVLLRELRKFQPYELEGPMKIKEKLAVQAFVDYQDMDPDAPGLPALLAYEGLVYRYIQAESFTNAEMTFAAEQLRILSAFYGSLHPLDTVHPYRLEMMCKIRINEKSLYQFWSDKLYRHLYQDQEPVVNLASEEYAKYIRKYLQPGDTFVDIEFLDQKNGRMKVVTAWAKMARGKMVRYVVQNQITDYRELKNFSEDGYRFVPGLSYENKYVFVRI